MRSTVMPAELVRKERPRTRGTGPMTVMVVMALVMGVLIGAGGLGAYWLYRRVFPPAVAAPLQAEVTPNAPGPDNRILVMPPVEELAPPVRTQEPPPAAIPPASKPPSSSPPADPATPRDGEEA